MIPAASIHAAISAEETRQALSLITRIRRGLTNWAGGTA